MQDEGKGMEGRRGGILLCNGLIQIYTGVGVVSVCLSLCLCVTHFIFLQKALHRS